MLKKLVKFGNSQALVLDRTLMGLLNLTDGDVVKLRIEGESLILRKDKPQSPQEALNLACDNISDLAETTSITRKYVADAVPAELIKMSSDHSYAHQVSSILPGGENYSSIQEDFAKIFAKYAKEMAVYASPEFLAEVNDLQVRFPGKSMQDEDFRAELMKIRKKFWSGSEQMDLELSAISKKYLPQ